MLATLTGRLSRRQRPGNTTTGVSRDIVVWTYRRLLGREPESEEVITAAMRLESPLALLDAVLGSAEFKGRRAAYLMDSCAPPLDVEWQVEPSVAARLLARIGETWERLGEDRPYWSVLAGPEYLPENAPARREAFYASGADDLRLLLTTLARVGRRATEFPVVFEFGCGLGRVTSHLCREFDRVIACDVSSSHLALAAAALRERDITNVTFVPATTADFGMSEAYDLWFNRLVLQHNPPPLIAAIVERALAMLHPGGLAVFQVPVYLAGYRFKVDEYLRGEYQYGPFEMHALPQGAILEIGYRMSCRLLEVREDDSAGDHWVSQFFTFERM